MNNFEILLDSAIKRCEGKYINDESSKYGFNYIYPFTTENISGYINKFKLRNRSLLTVGSSLDQTLNAILYDCKDITVLDINPYVKFYYYLKASCIISLTKEEYLKFFCYKDYPKVFKHNDDVFNIDIYNKIKLTLRILDYESYLFWDELFQMFNSFDIRDKLFSSDENRMDTTIKSNPYLKYEMYYDNLKLKLNKIKIEFVNSNVFNVDLKRKYDNIWLSNIGTYLSKNEINCLINKITKYLNADGTLLFCYLFNTTIDTKYKNEWSQIYNLKSTLEELKAYKIDVETFTGVEGLKFNDDSFKDSILIYKKC